MERAAISVARKIISRTCVVDTPLSPRLARVLLIVSRMCCRIKFLVGKKFGSNLRWFSTGNAEVGIWILSLVSARNRSSVQCCPFASVKKAPQDFDLRCVTPVNKAIISYDRSSIPVLGKVPLRVWRGDFRFLLDRNLVKSKKVRLILVRRACLRMNTIRELKNNDDDFVDNDRE